MATNSTQQKKKSPAEILKERKIIALQERICHDEEKIASMEETRATLARTDVLGLTVTHKTFGDGTIIEQDPSSITVKFDFGNKRFIMPTAFVDGFLTTEKAAINEKFSQYLGLGQEIKLVKEDKTVAFRSIQVLEKK